MICLGIETATETASIGLVSGKKELAEITRDCGRALSRDLMDMIGSVLEKAGTGRQDLDCIAVSIGPGSFTGLRIGLAAAKGMALSLSRPLVPVRTLDALARQIPDTTLPVAIIQRARKGEMFFALYTPDQEGLKKTVAEKVVTPRDLADELKTEAVMVGNAVPLYKDEIIQRLGSKCRFLENGCPLPSGMAIAGLGLSEVRHTQHDSGSSLEPFYIKEPDARVMES